MGESTGIGWTSKTWNPLQGCHKLSAGCKNCYMFSEKTRYGQDPNVVARSKPATFDAPLKWKEPSLIFTCSWSDWFIEEGDPHRAEMWDVIRRTPQHTYQILTKRAHRIADHLPEDWGDGWPNVWLGVSVENQEMADQRIPYLLKVPAAVRFLSCEPLLGPVELWRFDKDEQALRGPGVIRSGGTTPSTPDSPPEDYDNSYPGIDWIIIGGESDGVSGKNARECNLDWVHSLTEQCGMVDVPFFVKQLGAKPVYPDAVTGEIVPFPINTKKGDDPREMPCHFLQEWPNVEWPNVWSAATRQQLAAGRKQVQKAAEAEKPPVVKKSKKKRQKRK